MNCESSRIVSDNADCADGGVLTWPKGTIAPVKELTSLYSLLSSTQELGRLQLPGWKEHVFELLPRGKLAFDLGLCR
jgi:hypothetical protein